MSKEVTLYCEYIKQQLSLNENSSYKFSKELIENNICNRLVYELAGYIFSKDLDEIKFKQPKNWFEHLKQDVAPNWVKSKWPVKYDIKEIKVKEYYPYVSLPEKQPVIKFFVNEPSNNYCCN